jgi:hypothetical protein
MPYRKTIEVYGELYCSRECAKEAAEEANCRLEQQLYHERMEKIGKRSLEDKRQLDLF